MAESSGVPLGEPTREPAGESHPGASAHAQVPGLPSAEASSPRTPVLRVRGLSRSYDGRPAVQGLDLEVARGEVLGLLGPNGAGKTTTLRSIAGVLPLQGGSVEVAGHDLARSEVEAKRSLAWVPDDPRPFDALTVAEHLEFTAQLYGVEDHRERGRALLERFELAERAGALGSELSRGMRQKLAIAQAWLSSPAVVLLDEPLAGLDPRGIRGARLAIRELASEGTAVVLSSHQLDLVEAMADRLLVLSRGRVVFSGTLAELRAARAESSLEEVFLELTAEGDEA